MKKLSLIGGAFGLLLIGAAALAQNTVFVQSLTGNEVFQGSSGAGGSSFWVPGGLLRNTRSIALNGSTVGSVQLTQNQSMYMINAQPASALTLTLPTAPVPDGYIQEFANGTTSAFATQVITIQPASGQTLNGGNVTATTLAAKASLEFRYVLSNNTWYQIR
jgi:hypothetical protein